MEWINYKEWLFLKKWQKTQKRKLIESFRDGTYWETTDSESQRLWNKLRNKRWKK